MNYRTLRILAGGVALACSLLAHGAGVEAQGIDLNATLPVGPQVKVGKLANGLTYYIQKNGRPEKRLELRLVVKAGSILEDDDQQGLAAADLPGAIRAEQATGHGLAEDQEPWRHLQQRPYFIQLGIYINSERLKNSRRGMDWTAASLRFHRRGGSR